MIYYEIYGSTAEFKKWFSGAHIKMATMIKDNGIECRYGFSVSESAAPEIERYSKLFEPDLMIWRPPNQAMLIGIAAAAIAAALFFLPSCYSVPVVNHSDTSAQQAQLTETAKQLAAVPDRPENKLAPVDRKTIYRAGDQLESCAQTLAQKDKEINSCSGAVADCKTHFESEKAARKQCESENGFFGKWGLRLTWFGIGILFAIGAAAALYFSGAALKILAQLRPPGSL